MAEIESTEKEIRNGRRILEEHHGDWHRWESQVVNENG